MPLKDITRADELLDIVSQIGPVEETFDSLEPNLYATMATSGRGVHLNDKFNLVILMGPNIEFPFIDGSPLA